MILRLNSSHNNKIMDYLKQDMDFNMLMINDIERYGYDNYFLDVWGEVDKNGNIKGILIRYFEYLTFYSNSKFNVNEFSKLINNMKYLEICGRSDCLSHLYSNLNVDKVKTVKFCTLEKINSEYLLRNFTNMKKIRFGNINKIVNLYSQIDEFENTTVDIIKNNLKTGRGYCIEKNRRVVAMAKTTNENKTHAMIVGVATHPEYRNQGFATQCVSKICMELLAENKKPCLFYDNEEAGKIYEKIGFKELGNWSVYYPLNKNIQTIRV